MKSKNGFFGRTNNTNVEIATKRKVVGNEWVAEIYSDGRIVCTSQGIHNGQTYSLRYVIKPNGYSTLTKKVGSKEPKLIRADYVGRNLDGGEIILSNIEITRRGASYRSKEYKEFLQKHNIRSVIHFNPNKLYDIINRITKTGTKKTSIITDGDVKEENFRVTSEGEDYYDSRSDAKVTGATWVIYEENNGDRFLYTLKDVYTLNLP